MWILTTYWRGVPNMNLQITLLVPLPLPHINVHVHIYAHIYCPGYFAIHIQCLKLEIQVIGTQV